MAGPACLPRNSAYTAHAFMVTPADRRFTSRLFLVFGPLFVLGGLLFALTEVGAILVFGGLAMLVSGILLRTPLRTVLAVAAGVIVFAALTVQMVVVLNSR